MVSRYLSYLLPTIIYEYFIIIQCYQINLQQYMVKVFGKKSNLVPPKKI